MIPYQQVLAPTPAPVQPNEAINSERHLSEGGKDNSNKGLLFAFQWPAKVTDPAQWDESWFANYE